MTWSVRYTRAARDDLKRLYSFLLERDIAAAERALETIDKAVDLLRLFPFTCRKVDPENPWLRELVVSFGASGYVVLYDSGTIIRLRSLRYVISAKTTICENSNRNAAISTQVLEEFYVIVTRKLAEPLSLETAVRRNQSDSISFGDALIIEAALSAGAERLFSEDLQDGREIGGLRIENPFK